MFVYVAINELMPAYCKIGVSNDVTNRMLGLGYGDWHEVTSWDLGSNAFYYESRVKYKMRPFLVQGCGYELFNCPTTYLIGVINDTIDEPIIIEAPADAKTVSFDMKNIGKIIRDTRKSQGLTQFELANFSNVGVRFLSELELGKDTLWISKVFDVMRALGITLFYK